MKITIHTDSCISCGSCAAMAPTVFSVDSGVVSLKKDPSALSQEEKTQAKQAAELCPGSVIEITED